MVCFTSVLAIIARLQLACSHVRRDHIYGLQNHQGSFIRSTGRIPVSLQNAYIRARNLRPSSLHSHQCSFRTTQFQTFILLPKCDFAMKTSALVLGAICSAAATYAWEVQFHTRSNIGWNTHGTKDVDCQKINWSSGKAQEDVSWIKCVDCVLGYPKIKLTDEHFR